MFCNGAERCDPSAVGADGAGCVAGAPPAAPTAAFDDPCAAWVCDEATDGFVEGDRADGTACTVPLFCIPDGTCAAGVCAGPTVLPDLGDPCVVASCDGSDGFDVVDPNDANVCTIDRCEDGGVVVYEALPFDDGDPCTDDRCDAQLGVINAPVDIDDGDACTDDRCLADGTITHAPVVVDDQVACTVDSCDRALGVLHLADPTRCAAGESCDPFAGCVATGQTGTLAFSELQIAPGSGRFVELTNVSALDVELRGALLRDEDGIFGAARAVGGDGRIVVAPGQSVWGALVDEFPADGGGEPPPPDPCLPDPANQQCADANPVGNCDGLPLPCRFDLDADGTQNGDDAADLDPCVPAIAVLACAAGDADGDGVSNGDEPFDDARLDACAPDRRDPLCLYADNDGDGALNFEDTADDDPCVRNSAIDSVAPPSLLCTTADSDGDGTTNADEPAPGGGGDPRENPCVPSTSNARCAAYDPLGDTDGDGVDNTADADDRNACVRTAAIDATTPAALACLYGDTDGDGTFNGFEPVAPLGDPDPRLDPCLPDARNQACADENPAGACADGASPCLFDVDGDGVQNGADAADLDPCAPAVDVLACPRGDADDDGAPNGVDPVDDDACVPIGFSQACANGNPAGDVDGDGTQNDADDADLDACVPTVDVRACPRGDEDDDGRQNGADPDPVDPCIPDPRANGCTSDAAFVFVLSRALPDGGFDLYSARGTLLDGLPTFVRGVADPLQLGQLVLDPTGRRSTQVDVGRLSAIGNDALDAWCLAFGADDSRAASNHACRGAVLINEVLYDFA
ncbi:MAG: hypothetical protein FJ137_23075, partial [Deltaproteobacteria bacterium]|nr:hypothetical protein [Deltaproteobacteria bacterium]